MPNRTKVWLCLHRTLVATQVWSAVALSHLQNVEDVEFGSAVRREMLRTWCESACEAENAYAYRPHQIDIAATQFRLCQSSSMDTRGKKRPLSGSEAD